MRKFILVFILLYGAFNARSQEAELAACFSGSNMENLTQRLDFVNGTQLLTIQSKSTDGLFSNFSSDTTGIRVVLVCADKQGNVIWKNSLDSFNLPTVTIYHDSLILVTGVNVLTNHHVVVQYLNKNGLPASPVIHVKTEDDIISQISYPVTATCRPLIKGNDVTLLCLYSYFGFSGWYPIFGSVNELLYVQRDTVRNSIAFSGYHSWYTDAAKDYIISTSGDSGILAFNFDLSAHKKYPLLFSSVNVHFENNIIWMDNHFDSGEYKRYSVNLVNDEKDSMLLNCDSAFYSYTYNSFHDKEVFDYIERSDSVYTFKTQTSTTLNIGQRLVLSTPATDIQCPFHIDSAALFIVYYAEKDSQKNVIYYVDHNVMKWKKTVDEFGLLSANLQSHTSSEVFNPGDENTIYISVMERDTDLVNWKANYLYSLDINSGVHRLVYTGRPGYLYKYNDDLFILSTDKSDISCFPENYDVSLYRIVRGHNRITGHAFIDYNKNGIQDIGEPFYNNGLVLINGHIRTSTSLSGSFDVSIDSGQFAITLDPQSNFFTVVPDTFKVQFVGYNNTDTLVFAVQPTAPVYDGRIQLYNLTVSRAGTGNSYIVSVSNKGNFPFSGTVKLALDSRISLTWINIPYTVNGDTIEMYINYIEPGSRINISVDYFLQSPPVNNIGDTLFSFAQLQISGYSDSYTSDNSDALEDIIRGSFDPNDKLVKQTEVPDYQIHDEPLIYTIHFENTGTDTAFTISLLDTITENLDLSSFELLSSSAPFETSISGRVMKFTFRDIHLTVGGKGYITYTMKPSVNTGPIIRNSADIIFDYNIPVKTNTAVTRVTTATRSTTKSILPFSIYPNPANNTIRVEVSDETRSLPVTLSIIDITGKVQRKLVSPSPWFDVDLGNLPAGTYFFKLDTGYQSSGKIMEIIH